MRKIEYKEGERIRELIYIKDVGKNSCGKRTALFKCVCGNTFETAISSVKSGCTKSCGCLFKKATTRHGLAKTTEYSSWHSMITRCNDPNYEYYHRYGGRGIKVCERWLNSVENFLEDMGPKPSKNHSLDRIDVDGDYCPENCRWATYKEQSNNKSNSKFIRYDNREMTVTEWAREVGMAKATLFGRLRKGWGVKKSLTHPVRGRVYARN